ncbi:MAG: FtsQ-type POTRA domain-containing protein [Acidobacteriota bacterium]
MSSELDRDGRVLPFRRRAFAAKRRKRSLWLMILSGLAGALLIVGLPLGLVAWVLTTPRFALRKVETVGGPRVAATWVQSALSPLVGTNLLTLPIAQVHNLLEHPWIEAVEVRKQLPDRLLVQVVERQPAALIREAGGLWYLDAEGRRIAPFTAGDGGGSEKGVDLLLVSSSSDLEIEPGRALELAREVRAAQPEWADKLSEIEVLGEEDFCLYTAALPFPLLVKRGTLAERGRSLADLLPELTRRYPHVSAVDLRFERRIVIQPMVEEGGTAKPVPAALNTAAAVHSAAVFHKAA